MGRQEIVADIKSKLDSGEWYPGFRLPSTRELAIHYEVAAGTIDTVMEILRAQGITFDSVAGGRRYVPGAPHEDTGGLSRSDVEEDLRRGSEEDGPAADQPN